MGEKIYLCLNCGEVITHKNQNPKYCSRSCYYEHQRKKPINLCLNCGKDISHKPTQKYCSRSCHYDSRYGKSITYESIEARNPLFFDAAKLIAEGFTQEQAAERVGINKYTLISWLNRHNAKNGAIVFSNRVCGYCGSNLIGNSRLNRKYCSKSCKEKAMNLKKHPNKPHKLWQHEKGVFEDAMDLYRRGVSGSAIAKHLGLPKGTVKSWIYNFGEQREEVEEFLQFRLGFSKASKLPTIPTKPPVHLVCGNVHGYSVNKFATIIFESLKSDPLSGDVFAFCNKCSNAITTLSWEEPIFKISKYIKVSGTFIWPCEDLGKSIEVTATEFEYLLSFCKYNKITS